MGQIKIASSVKLFDKDSAREIVNNCMYEKQRPLNEDDVRSLAVAMSNGTFAPVSNIMFADVGGDNRCINGNHTLHAIIRSNVPQMLVVNQYVCQTQNERDELYYRIDRQRRRNLKDSIRATNLPEKLDLTPTQISMIVASLRFVKGNWGVVTQVNRLYSDDEMLPLAHWWADDCRMMYDAISPCGSNERRLIIRRSVMPIALVTMHYQQGAAYKFWRQYVQDDGLARKDPRKTARNWVYDNTRKTGTSAEFARDHVLARGVIHAWNAFFDGRDLSYIRVNDASKKVMIKGTPYTGYQDDDFLPEWGELNL